MRLLPLLVLGACAPVVAWAPEKVEERYSTDTAPDSGAPTDDSGESEEVPGAGDLSAELFSDDELPHFEIVLDEEAWAVLAAETSSNRYNWVEGTFIYDGHEYPQVGVRTKGENSWQSINEKPSLKVKFDLYVEGGSFRGLDELTLDAMNDDASKMHERVAYRLYREAGVAASRATHATLTINDVDYGVYTHVETVDRQLVQRWYEDDTGPLFEQADVDFFDTYVPLFQIEYGEDDRTALQGVADAMEQSSPANRIAAANEWLDYDSFLRYWAVGAYVAQFDAYPYSSPGDDCHVFFDAGAGRLQYLPHGVDETFYYPDASVVDYTAGVLGRTCLQDPDCAAAWVDTIWEVAEVAEAIDYLGYFDFVLEQVGPLVEADERISTSSYEIAYYQDVMRDMIENRPEALATQLGGR